MIVDHFRGKQGRPCYLNDSLASKQVIFRVQRKPIFTLTFRAKCKLRLSCTNLKIVLTSSPLPPPPKKFSSNSASVCNLNFLKTFLQEISLTHLASDGQNPLPQVENLPALWLLYRTFLIFCTLSYI